ncbi:DUF4198 domain-containing protein [Ramlibacter algicola]|uniref:DUF4198 domain-containing protein n=1 Tax=Ramlibacter algicola TaxID=2795217 RepID=A0A934UQ92_9BURK|nr:DUF4198 domain-containing protein [Ramlibacter algicola]MBK0392379.1 DUF4198 domain-containing protein [Ramlibacter algicola]
MTAHFTLRLLFAAAMLSSAAVHAHDTWLHVGADQPGSGLLALELGTGSRYPRSEGVVPGSRVVASGCVDDTGEARALTPRRELERTLELRSRVGTARAAACWMELLPVDLTLTPELVRQYLDDVRAPQAVRDAWAAQQAAGVGWTEVYRKYVRLESPVPGAEPAASLAALRAARSYPLELVPVGGDSLRTNVPATFQALSKGQPVPGLAVEFVNVRSPFGIWRETDAQGRIQLALPLAGEWLLRSTAFDLPHAQGEAWHTRFATLTVTVR